jgi:hypothetical protein
VIGGVYPNGGNSGATYKRDYVYLHNRGLATIDLTRYSLQLNDATSSAAWEVVSLSGMLEPGAYYLVQVGSPGPTGGALPAADATTNFDLSPQGGRVAIVLGQTALTGDGPFDTLDLVGYGSASAYEGSAASTISPAGKALTRTRIGQEPTACVDTNQNASDFTSTNPQALSSATAHGSCASCP